MPFITDLDPVDLRRLREITRRIHAKDFPGLPVLTDHQCDVVIERIGVETSPGKARNLTLARDKTDKPEIPFAAAQEALAAEGITDEERSTALAKIKEGLLPFNGDWYTHDEIVRLQRRSRRRSLVALVEVLALLFVILAADAVLALVLVRLAG